MSRVRVRIAPSPTGEPHVGTAYIALFNYCFAKVNNGDFILRIEDTDQTRSTKESEDSIFKALSWLGIKWNEGPDIGGQYAPYRQSERIAIYKEQAETLLSSGKAYRCFCSAGRLEEMRKKLIAEKKNYFYDGLCRTLSQEESDRRANTGEPFVIRMAVPRQDGATTKFFDEIRQKEIELAHTEIDDQILLKADGFPTYHLANVVDDHLMRISHVIRAEEWITSTPKHILLYNAFGWEAPKFAHVSLLRNSDKSKVSKRKNPVSLNWFRAAGYTKEAIINFLGLMGYYSGTDNERFGIAELSKDFALNKISTSAPIFDMNKLNALNEEYIRKMEPDQYAAFLGKRAFYRANYLKPVLPLVQERHKINSDFEYWTNLFFIHNLSYNKDSFAIKGAEKQVIEKILKELPEEIDAAKPLSSAEFEAVINKAKEKSAPDKNSPFMTVIRVALTGSTVSLPIGAVMATLGKDRCILRLKEAASFVRNNLKSSDTEKR